MCVDNTFLLLIKKIKPCLWYRSRLIYITLANFYYSPNQSLLVLFWPPTYKFAFFIGSTSKKKFFIDRISLYVSLSTEPLLKGKTKCNWPPWTNSVDLLLFQSKIQFTFVTKQATLIWRSNVLPLRLVFLGLPLHPDIRLSICLLAYSAECLSICLFIYPSDQPLICLSVAHLFSN